MMTTIVDELDNEFVMDLSDKPFFPDGDFNFTFSLYGEPYQQIIRSHAYSTPDSDSRKGLKYSHMSSVKTSDRPYPVIISSTYLKSAKKGPGDFLETNDARFRVWWSSKFLSNHFVSKVILVGTRHPHAFNDWEGKYAVGKHAIAFVVSSKEEAELMTTILNGQKFQDWIATVKWQSHQTNYKVFDTINRYWYLKFS